MLRSAQLKASLAREAAPASARPAWLPHPWAQQPNGGQLLPGPERQRFERDFSALPLHPRPAAVPGPGPAGWQVAAPGSAAERQAAAAARQAQAPAAATPGLAAPGLDLSAVHLHAEPEAAPVAAAFEARAVTLGQHIYFAPGQYQPASAAGRALLAHEVAHAAQAPTPGVAFREPWLKSAGAWYDEKTAAAGKSWDQTKWAAYRAMIAALKKSKSVTLDPLRARIPDLPAYAQGFAQSVLFFADFVGDMLIALLLVIVGLAVGFVEGIVGLVNGLIQLGWKLFVYTAECFAALFGKPDAALEDTRKLLATLENLKPALIQAKDAWVERYNHATLEEQAIMGAELVGQLEAFIATFALGAGKAGQAGAALARTTEGLGALAKGAGGLQPALAGGISGGAAATAGKAGSVAALAGNAAGGLAVISAQAMQSTGGGGGPPTPLDVATVQAKQDVVTERAAVAARRDALAPGKWAKSRAGLTKRLYNLMEHHAALIRMKVFPNSTWLEQATVKGIEVNGVEKATEAISSTGTGRIADLLELKGGDTGVLEDLKTASTQKKSVAGGMAEEDLDAVFRNSSEIAKQHKVEEEVIAAARQEGGKVVVVGRDPLTGQQRTVKLDPNKIGSRVTAYETVGDN